MSTVKRLAFTGTRSELPEAQVAGLRRELERLQAEGFEVLMHGDCVGADAVAHGLALELGWSVHMFPPNKAGMRAMCEGATWVESPQPYLKRNRAMVERAQLLVACPWGEEIVRSGVWATVRYARKRGVVVRVVRPDGDVV